MKTLVAFLAGAVLAALLIAVNADATYAWYWRTFVTPTDLERGTP